MIRERAETEEFVLEIALEIKNSGTIDTTYYEQSVKNIVNLIAGALCSGELFPFFMEELIKVSEKLISALQTEQVLKEAKKGGKYEL